VVTPFAALETRLGARTAAMLADATLSAGDLAVDGILDQANLEQGGLMGRRTQFVCASDDLEGTTFEEDDPVTITKNAVATDYLVAIAPSVEGGQTRIDLKRST